MAVANQITLRTEFVPVLDEVYKLESKSAILDSAPELVRLEAGEFKIPIMELDGLANHDRTNGGRYVDGSSYLGWQTKQPTYSRNRKFTVDVQDNYETSDVAFGRLSGEFIRTKVVPEIDALRFAKYSQLAGTKVIGQLASASDVVNALLAAKTKLDEDEVPENERYAFITFTAYNQVLLLQTIDSKAVLEAFTFVKVPQSRLVTAITLRDGKTAGQEQGGWAKASGAQDINFLVIYKPAVIQGLKHTAPKHIPAAVNQDADGDSYAYRVDGVEEVYSNKIAGIYAHIKGTAAASYTLTFDANGGKGTPQPLTVVTGTEVAKPEIEPVKKGATFNGWFAAATGGTALVFPLEVTADRTIYAQYTE